MNKKVWVGAVIVFIAFGIMDYVVHSVLMMSTYQSMVDSGTFRAPDDAKMHVFFLVRALQSFFFALVFSKGYESKGMAEGIRYGLYMGVFGGVAFSYFAYGIFPIPYELAMKWFLYELVQWVIAGVLIAQYWGMKPKASG